MDRGSLRELEGKVTADVLAPDNASPLQLELSFLSSGNLRFRVTEKPTAGPPRWQPTDLLVSQGLAVTQFNRVEAKDLPAQWKNKEATAFSAYRYRASHPSLDQSLEEDTVVVLQHSPLKLEVYRENALVLAINERNLMHYEQRSAASSRSEQIAQHHELSHEDRHKGKEVIDYGEDGLAIYADGSREERADVNHASHDSNHGESHVETFQGHTDTVPNGPMSVGIDFSFPCASHLYGIPEHTTPLSLPTTIAGSAERSPQHSQPYRLYNLDVFEFELQETMALYGNIPLLWGHGRCSASAGSKHVSAGVFWFNPSESFVDVSEGGSKSGPLSSLLSSSSTFRESHWMSESGEIDVFVLPGSSPKALIQQFASVVGTQQLPPLFSLGYHQCRWNYRDERDVAQVNSQFEALDYPYDVIWLDIEHTNGKRYFTVSFNCFEGYDMN